MRRWTSMLIRFTVENFLSFKDEVEFSMVAGRARKHPDHVVRVRDLRLLKTGVILGANASGKTNLIKAISFAQDFITTGSMRTEYLPLTPFLLDSTSEKRPSKFLFEIQCGIGQSFEYTFVVDEKRVHKESLYEILPSSTRMMFERETDSEGHTNIEFGALTVVVTNEKEPFDFIPKSGNRKLLFLTQYKKLEERIKEPRIAFLAMIYDWFATTLAPIFTDSVPPTPLGLGYMDVKDFEKRYVEILEQLDLGIDGIRPVKIPDFNAEKHLPGEFREYVKTHVAEMPKDSDERAIFYYRDLDLYVEADSENQYSVYNLMTLHRVKDYDGARAFDLRMESDGTRRLLTLIPELFGLLSDNIDRVFVLDELDRSLHTQLSYKLLELFLNNSGDRRSQLIVTTHDTSLLDLDLLRRDEIWFVEKDGYGVSSLYSLEEFKLPKGIDIEKGYLGGRFGAIPILSIFDELELAE
jgi:hypothetical protein